MYIHTYMHVHVCVCVCVFVCVCVCIMYIYMYVYIQEENPREEDWEEAVARALERAKALFKVFASLLKSPLYSDVV
jgi:hypothetical protein